MKRFLQVLGVAAAALAAWHLASPVDAAPVRHSDLGPSNGIHAIFNWAPADTSAMNALSVTSGDIGKIARKSDTGEYFVLTNNVGPAWTKIPGLNHTALSILGRSANSAGVWADISAGSNDTLLRRESNALSFGQLTLGMIPNGLITGGKLATADTVKYRTTTYSWRGSSLSATASATFYITPYFASGGGSIGGIGDAQIMWGRAGSIKNLRFVSINGGTAATFTVTININSGDTAVTLTASGDSTSMVSDTTHSASIAVGDLFAIKQLNGGGAISITDYTLTFDFEESP